MMWRFAFAVLLLTGIALAEPPEMNRRDTNNTNTVEKFKLEEDGLSSRSTSGISRFAESSRRTLLGKVRHALCFPRRPYIPDFIARMLTQLALKFAPGGGIVAWAKTIYDLAVWFKKQREKIAKLFTFFAKIKDAFGKAVKNPIESISGIVTSISGFLDEAMSVAVPAILVALGFRSIKEKLLGAITKAREAIHRQFKRVFEKLAKPFLKRIEPLLKKFRIGGTIIAGPVEMTVDDEKHSLWVETDGKDAVVKLGSQPTTLKDQLNLWGRCPNIGSTTKDRITKACTLSNKVKVNGTKILLELREAKQTSGANAVKDKIESINGTLKNELAKEVSALLHTFTTREGKIIQPPAMTSTGNRKKVIAILTTDMLDTGSEASDTINPPGWPTNHMPVIFGRGHLLARQLGGSGTDEANLVTLYTKTNSPAMSQCEERVADALRCGARVLYEVTPNYGSANKYKNLPEGAPSKIIIQAWIIDSTEKKIDQIVDVSIINEPNPQKAYCPKSPPGPASC